MYSLYKGAHIKVVEGPVQVITLPHPPGLCAVLLTTLLPHSLLPQVTHSEIIIIIIPHSLSTTYLVVAVHGSPLEFQHTSISALPLLNAFSAITVSSS